MHVFHYNCMWRRDGEEFCSSSVVSLRQCICVNSCLMGYNCPCMCVCIQIKCLECMVGSIQLKLKNDTSCIRLLQCVVASLHKFLLRSRQVNKTTSLWCRIWGSPVEVEKHTWSMNWGYKMAAHTWTKRLSSIHACRPCYSRGHEALLPWSCKSD